MGVREMRQDAEREVAACGVAGNDDVRRFLAEVLQRVPEEFDALGQLARVGGCGREGVVEEENGGVFAGRVELRDDVGENGDVVQSGWKAVSSSLCAFSIPDFSKSHLVVSVIAPTVVV